MGVALQSSIIIIVGVAAANDNPWIAFGEMFN